ncbi:N-acetylglucosamine-6-phosphate deacetylase [Candidatus Hepatincola sp. Pdp]
MVDQSYALVDGKVFNGKTFTNSTVLVVGNKITGLAPHSSLQQQITANTKVINLKDCIISAGFIDLQLNGCGGVLFNDAISTATLQTMYNTVLQFGCTSFLPTLITTSFQDMEKAVAVATSFYQQNPYKILGLHLEGPCISTIKKGIHNPKYIQPLTAKMVDFLCQAGQKIPLKITLAPEVNDLALIRELIKAGVKVSIGHTNANYEEVDAVIQSGATLATHLFNAMSGFEGRNPNAVGAILNNPKVYTGIIIDGVHVDYHTIQIVHKIKQDKLFIVTDGVTPMGTNLQEFMLADQKIYVKNNKCVNANGVLAGTNINMFESLKNAVLQVKIPLDIALNMVSLYPAYAMGIANKLGNIQVGSIANLAIFHEKSWQYKYTMAAGKLYTYS